MNISCIKLPIWANPGSAKDIRRINDRIDLIIKILEDNGLYEKPPTLPFTETTLVTKKMALKPYMKDFLITQQHRDEMSLYRMALRDNFDHTKGINENA